MKTRSLTKPVDYIWSGDPALDLPTVPEPAEPESGEPSATDKARGDLARKYVESLFDPQFRPIREGKTPVRFKLAPLPHEVKLRLEKIVSPAERAYLAAIHSLCGVSGWEHNGEQVSIGADDMTATKPRRLKDEWLEKFYDQLLFMELGVAVLEVTGLFPLND